MRPEHREIQQWIKDRYSHVYEVAIEIDRQNYLPDKERHLYQPDVIVYDKKGRIKYIIEVENDPMRKALVGACILADYSIAELKQRLKPKLIFVVYNEKGIRQMHNFTAKIIIAKEYCLYLRNIEIYSENDFKKMQI